MHWIDPDCLPRTEGNVERFLVNPHGEIDGVILNGASETTFVHVPPHLSAEIEAAIKIGDAIGVRGLRPRGTSMIAAVAMTAADGRAIVDHGPSGKRDEHKRGEESRKPGRPSRMKDMNAAGKVRMSLHAPKGELRGALLDDGSIVRLAPGQAHRFAALLQPGASLAVRGDGIETPHGRVVEVREIGSDPGDLTLAECGKAG
jgi:hypothetical protein